MLSRIRVVIADDNQEYLDGLVQSLRSDSQIEVVATATTGTQVIELLNLHVPDVLVLDLVMPNLDGADVLGTMYLEGLFKKTKVIVVSSVNHHDSIKDSTESGASYYFAKPVAASRLASAIHKVIKNEPLKKPSKVKTYEDQLDELFIRIGVPPHTKGRAYLKDSIMCLKNDSAMVGKITTVVFPVIAERHQKNYKSVERAIRHTVDLTFERGDMSLIQQYFGNYMKQQGRLTSCEFINCVSSLLKNNVIECELENVL